MAPGVRAGSDAVIAPATASRQVLAPPRAAAVAGVIFSVLLIVSLGLIRLAVPTDAEEPGSWLSDPTRRNAIGLALHLVPFAGIAFLWFMGVLRNRLGALEDQFFATVFFGSGLLFVAILFDSAATAGGLLAGVAAGSVRLAESETFAAGRETTYVFLNIFGIKMASVFTFSTCTIGLKTGILPRWLALVGYACAAVLLLVIANWAWIALLFPLWILLASAYILVADFRQSHHEGAGHRTGNPSQHATPPG
jgi:hypothetical protein